MRELTVGPASADVAGMTNQPIQAAIDRVAGQGGGSVRLLPGRYELRDSIHLRSNVQLLGSGAETVLWKPPSRSAPVRLVNGYGLYSVMVAAPGLFEVGDGVCVTDRLAGAFYDTVATVSWRDGEELGLSRPLNHDISESSSGTVTTVYPCVSGVGVENARVEQLVIEGNSAENALLGGCRGGGIYFLRARNVTIDSVIVRDFNGEGISFQHCRDILVQRTTLEHNRGSGLHPGSGSVGFTFRGIVSRANDLDGIFYCLQVSHSRCEDSVITGNGRDGLSIGHRDTDALICGNTIEGNGRYGVYFREDSAGLSGDRTVIENNCFRCNGRAGGEGDIFFDAKAAAVSIHANRFEDGDNKLSRSPVYLNRQSGPIWFYGNRYAGQHSIGAAKKEYLKQVYTVKPEPVVTLEPESRPPKEIRKLEFFVKGQEALLTESKEKATEE